MALCFISHLNRVSMSVAGNQKIMAEFGFSTTQMGTVYSAFLFVYTLCMIPGGSVIDRIGPRRALGFMGIGSAIFGALTGVVGLGFVIAGNALLTLLLIRGVMGLLTTPLHPGCARSVNFWVPLPQRSLANGFVNGAALLGIACTYPVFGRLIDRFNWPGAFLITGICTALLTSLWMIYATDRPRQHAGVNEAEAALHEPVIDAPSVGPGASASWTSLIRNRSLILLTLSYGAVGYFQYLFFYWMQYYFEQVLHLGKTASEFYAGLPSLAMAVGMPLGGLLSDRLQKTRGRQFGRSMVSIVSLLASAGFLVLGIFAKQPGWIVTWFSLALGVMGASEGPFWSSAVEIGRKRGGMAAAIMNTGGNGGGMLAPVITPWVSEHYGWPIGIGLGAAVCLFGALCWRWIDLGEEESMTESPLKKPAQLEAKDEMAKK